MSLTHFPTLPMLHLRHSTFSKPTVASPTSQLLLQPFCRFTYITVHSPTLPLLHLRHSSFSNPSVALPTSQLILQPFRRFTYVTAHSPTLPSLYLRHSSFSNPYVASPTSQLILQPFFRFCYVTGSSLNVTSRAAHAGRGRRSIPMEVVNKVAVAVVDRADRAPNSGTSARAVSRELGLPWSTVRKILRCILH